jgi:hypothetical protein
MRAGASEQVVASGPRSAPVPEWFWPEGKIGSCQIANRHKEGRKIEDASNGRKRNATNL